MRFCGTDSIPEANMQEPIFMGKQMMIKKEKMGGLRRNRFMALPALIFLCMGSTYGWSPSRLQRYIEKDDAWYSSEEGKTVLENILSWQDENGSWPKNLSTASKPFTGDRKDLHGTFDNAATTGEMRVLAHAYRITKDSRYQEAFLKGLDLILKAQYPTGGWPQQYPPGRGYNRHITFNDNAMVRLLVLLDEVADSPKYDFVDAERRVAAGKAFHQGIDCILKCQIRVRGELTAWCAQHDEIDYRPQPARSYELVSLSGGESAEILQLLMRLEDPSPEVIRAVTAGVQWFESSKVEGLRIKWIEGKRTAVKDPEASTLWARFDDIETHRPLFCDRDGIPKYDYNQIDPERTEGYAWYGSWGKEVLEEYDAWREKFKDRIAAVKKEPLTLVLIGDSTVCDFPDNDSRHGWGEYIQEYFTDSVKVINRARSGRSTKTFLGEGLWEKVLQEKPAYILIQFGHNDNHAPEEPESTDADTEYADNLRRYVGEARAIGAEPVLVTPVHRRKFRANGQLNDTLLPYADAMRKVAAEKNVALIDLHKISGEKFLELGETGCQEIGNDPEDRTHFNEKGARMLAGIIMDQLPQVRPELKPLLKESDKKEDTKQ